MHFLDFHRVVWLALIVTMFSLVACGHSQPPPAPQHPAVDYEATIKAAQSTIQTEGAKQPPTATPRHTKTATPKPAIPTFTPQATTTATPQATATAAASPTPAGPSLSGKIVFLSDRFHREVKLGPVDIFVMNSDGSDVQQIPIGMSFPSSGSFVVSPDGRTIAVGVYGNSGLDAGIYLFTIEGKLKDMIPITEKGATVWSWAKNNRILFSLLSDEGASLYTANPDTGELVHLASDADANFHYGSQSPDGSLIAYLHHYPEQTIWLMDGEGNNKRPWIDFQGYRMAWSPDSKRLAVDDYQDIFIVDVVNGEMRNVTKSLQKPALVGSWSPDGKSLAFMLLEGQFYSSIYVLDLVTGKTTELTNGTTGMDPFWVP